MENKIVVREGLLMTKSEIEKKISSLEKRLTLYRGAKQLAPSYKPLFFSRVSQIEVLYDTPCFGDIQEIPRSTIITGPFETAPEPDEKSTDSAIQTIFYKYFPLEVKISDFTELFIQYRQLSSRGYASPTAKQITAVEGIINEYIPLILRGALQCTHSSDPYNDGMETHLASFSDGCFEIHHAKNVKDHPWLLHEDQVLYLSYTGTREFNRRISAMVHGWPWTDACRFSVDPGSFCKYLLHSNQSPSVDWMNLPASGEVIK